MQAWLKNQMRNMPNKPTQFKLSPRVLNAIGAGLGGAITNYVGSPFGFQTPFGSRGGISDTAATFLFGSAIGIAVGTIVEDDNANPNHPEQGYLAGSGAIIGCDVGENVANILGLNTQIGCVSGSLSGAYLLDRLKANYGSDSVKFGLSSLALSGAYHYFLSLKKNRIEIALSRMMELTDPFLRNNIDPSPNMDARIWACACQRLSKKIKENDALSPPEKEKLANIVIALRNAKNSNEHLQINAKNENDNLRDMNEHEYMLIANLLGSLLRAAQSDNVELEN